MWGDKAEAERESLRASRGAMGASDGRSLSASVKSNGSRDLASMGWLESVSHQWETGTGLFGPVRHLRAAMGSCPQLVPEPPKDEVKAAERERQQTVRDRSVGEALTPQAWDQRPKRPGLVSRLSSAVSMTLFSGSSTSSPVTDRPAADR